MNWKLIGEVVYRLFASLILIAIEVAVYFVVLATSINAGKDIFEADCIKQGTQCGAFPLAAQAQMIFIAILVVSILLLGLYVLWPLTRKQTKRAKSETDEEPEEIEDEDDV